MKSLLMNFSSIEFWLDVLEQFRSFGWLAPICLACLESFFPALPLLAIITFNLAVYGIVKGTIASWIGTTLGSLLVFVIFRKIIKPLFFKIKKPIKFTKMHFPILNEVNVFILYSFPFAPGNLFNVALGFSDFKMTSFFKIVPLAKLVFILIVVLFNVLGYHFSNSWQGWVFIGIGIIIFWILKRSLDFQLKSKE